MKSEYKEYQLSDHFKDVNFLKYASVDEKDNALMAMNEKEQQGALIKLVDYVPEDAIFLLIRHATIDANNVIDKLIELTKFKDAEYYEPLLHLAENKVTQLTYEHKTKIEKVRRHRERWLVLQSIARGEIIDLSKDTISSSASKAANILNNIPVQPRQRYYNAFVKSVDVIEAVCRVSIMVNEIDAHGAVRKCEQSMKIYQNALDGRYSPLNALIQLVEYQVKGVDKSYVESLVYNEGTIWNQLYFQFKVKKDFNLLKQREYSILNANPYNPSDTILFVRHFPDIADMQSHVDCIMIHGNARDCYNMVMAGGEYLSKRQAHALYEVAQKAGRDFNQLSILEQEGFYLKTVESSIFEYGANRFTKGTQLLKNAFNRFRDALKRGALDESPNTELNTYPTVTEKKDNALTFNNSNMAKLIG